MSSAPIAICFHLTMSQMKCLTVSQMKSTTRGYQMTARATSAEQTHSRIIGAARTQFLAAPYDDVTLAGIAAEAGVTTQTVLNRFGSKERLFTAFMQVFHTEIDDVRSAAVGGNTRSVVRVLLRQYELMGDTGIRVLSLEDRIPALADMLRTARSRHRSWLEDVFADQLPSDVRARKRTLTAVYAATDLYLWKLLRRDLNTSLAETARVLERLVTGALAPDP